MHSYIAVHLHCAMKRQRQDRTVAEKVELLNRYKALPTLSQRKAAEILQISRGFLQNLLKNEAALRAEDCEFSTAKRKRGGKDGEVENALFAWFKVAQNMNVPINGNILKLKAKDIAQAVGHQGFNATSGWFSRWKRRHSLTLTPSKGEAAKACIGEGDNFHLIMIQDILKTYCQENIYIAIETGLHFRALPQSFSVKKEQNTQTDLKSEKDRVTLLVAFNMNGDKEDLMLIGHSKSPRCFKNITHTPISYNFSVNALMTNSIFEQWLTSWDTRLQSEGRKVALLVSNCSAHNSITDLRNISMYFLPQNTILGLQSSKMGITCELKAYFRHKIYHKIIDIIDDSENLLDIQAAVKQIHLLDAMLMMKEAWNKISNATIQNGWRTGGFIGGKPTKEEVRCLSALPGLSVEQFGKWVAVDDGVKVVEELTEDQVVGTLASQIQGNEVQGEDHDSDYDVDGTEEAAPSAAEMRSCLRRLASGLNRTAFKDMDMFYSMKSKIDDHLRETFPPKDTSLFHFFLPPHD